MMLRVSMSFGFGSTSYCTNKAYRSTSAFAFFFSRYFAFLSFSYCLELFVCASSIVAFF